MREVELYRALLGLTVRHAPVGTGVVPFAVVPPLLEEIGYAGPPMLEIICEQPDTEIPASIHALNAMGWGRIARC